MHDKLMIVKYHIPNQHKHSPWRRRWTLNALATGRWKITNHNGIISMHIEVDYMGWESKRTTKKFLWLISYPSDVLTRTKMTTWLDEDSVDMCSEEIFECYK